MEVAGPLHTRNDNPKTTKLRLVTAERDTPDSAQQQDHHPVCSSTLATTRVTVWNPSPQSTELTAGQTLLQHSDCQEHRHLPSGLHVGPIQQQLYHEVCKRMSHIRYALRLVYTRRKRPWSEHIGYCKRYSIASNGCRVTTSVLQSRQWSNSLFRCVAESLPTTDEIDWSA